MNTTYDEPQRSIADRPRARIDVQAAPRAWNWPSLGAVAGLSGGLTAALIGSLLTASAWFAAPGAVGSDLRAFGTICLFMTIPLLVFGAHCLDLMEKRKERERISRFHEQR